MDDKFVRMGNWSLERNKYHQVQKKPFLLAYICMIYRSSVNSIREQKVKAITAVKTADIF